MAHRLDETTEQRGSKTVVIAPRGNAKSTWGSFFHPLKMALKGLERYIWIISDTASQTAQHISNIVQELEDNEELEAEFPTEIAGFRCVGNKIILGNGCIIEGLSTGQKVRGRRSRAQRPSLIILDDPENDEQVANPDQREKTWEWFTKALLKAGNLKTNFVVLGTAIHSKCLVCRLAKTAGWESKTFSSIVDWPERMDMWSQWEQLYLQTDFPNYKQIADDFYQENIHEMQRGAKVLWPEWEPLYDLMKMRAEEGHNSFASEKQGNPINPENCEWPEEYFSDHIWFDDWPLKRVVMSITLDPSKGSDSKRGDYSAIVKIVLTEDGIFYIDADLERRPIDKIVNDFIKWCYREQTDIAGVESNAFQQLLSGIIDRECLDLGYHLNLHQIENTVNKLVRIRRLTPYLSHKVLRFKRNSPVAALLVDQMKDFPIGDHDDGPDALEMGIRLINEMLTNPSTEDQDDYLATDMA